MNTFLLHHKQDLPNLKSGGCLPVLQASEKRHARRQHKAKYDEKAPFYALNEHFEAKFEHGMAKRNRFQPSSNDFLTGISRIAIATECRRIYWNPRLRWPPDT